MIQEIVILIIGNNPDETQVIERFLSEEKVYKGSLIYFDKSAAAIKYLKNNDADIVLIDLPVIDRKGLKTINQIISVVPECPVIILIEESSLEEAEKIIGSDVQDYLIKDKYTQNSFVRSVRYAIELKQTREALRRSEERFQVMSENVGDIIYQMDLSMRFTYITPSVYPTFGYTQEEWIGSHLSDHASSRSFRKMAGIIARSLKEIATFKDITFETEMIHKDGTELPVEILGRIILNENRIPVGLQGVTRVITERKRMEKALEDERNLLSHRVEESTAALRQTNAELMRALKIKDNFLANMSHELRTPLTAILGLSEMLELNFDKNLDEHQTNSIQLIHNSGKHLLQLINDVLDISKIQAGKMEIDSEDIVVEDLCRASLSLVQGMARSKDQALDYLQDDTQLVMQADSLRLKQILVNLINNAIKFTPNGGKITLEVKPDKTKETICFIIEDNGIGIVQEDMGNLFQPFTQLDSGLSRRHEGSGLGLALVKQLVDLHHGDIFVESQGIPGEGSRFTVVLPKKQNNIGPKVPTGIQFTGSNSTINPDSDDLDNPEDKLILLAEDNQANIQTIRDYLEMVGYRIIIAENGLEAIDSTQNNNPDLILMDIQMPIMDGLEAIRYIKKNPHLSKIPIIALTALAMPGDRKRCLEAGADDYISKPINLRKLASRVRDALD
ncbi:MAG: response regulator [Anaerolineaceae bacterium]|nr:response regulator [Anaerolineaceae bacterium]